VADDDPVLLWRDGPLLRLRLNRPHRLNAVSAALYDRMERALDAAWTDETVRGVLLDGAGRAFCAGADLKAHLNISASRVDRSAYLWAGQRVCWLLRSIPKPVVCAVHGYALGGGAELALNCDFVVCATDAQVGFPEVEIGTYVGGAVSAFLMQSVGPVRARRMLLLGERLSGAEAASVGLVHGAAPPEQLESAAVSLAMTAAAKPSTSFALGKTDLARLPEPAWEVLGREVSSMLACMATPEWRTGVQRFNEGDVNRSRARRDDAP
jgi:enoyl-CoA hydratase/carnithine racemase